MISAAKELGCEVEMLMAVAEVEAFGDGMLKSGKPKILFESFQFHKFTKGHYDRSHPNLSTNKWVRNYIGGEKEWKRLDDAMALDLNAALKATSWGKFQIMGFNYKEAGYNTVVEFVDAMSDENNHLKAFVNLLKFRGLDEALRNKHFSTFARLYNGKGYKKNRYDLRLESAYNRLKKSKFKN